MRTKKERTLLVLQAARDVIAAGFWTKDYFATNGSFPRPEYSEEACYFCAIGAIRAAARDLVPSRTRERVLKKAEKTLSGVVNRTPILWNDAKERRRSEVVEAFERAIESLEA